MSKPVIVKQFSARVFVKIDDEYFCIYEYDTYRCIYACDDKLRIYTDIYWQTRYTIDEMLSSKQKIKAAICRR